MRYDVAIVGAGPAGISAAITLKIRNKSILLLGSQGLSEKIKKAHSIQNYPGLPDISGMELSKKLEDHLNTLSIDIKKETVSVIYAMGEYYALQTKNNLMYEANAVILATGVSMEKLYPGEETYLGKGVSYCATCDAPLYRDKTVIVIGASKKEEKEADFLSEIAKKVYYIPLYSEDTSLADKVDVIRKKPVSIEGIMKADKLILEDGKELLADGIFILRDSISTNTLVPGLAMNGNHVATDRTLKTNLEGLFVCGDITGIPYQYIKAAGEGNVAALAAVQYLSQKLKQK